MGVIRDKLIDLVRFRGRDPRSRFWPYAALVFVLLIICAMALLPPVLRDAGEKVRRFAALHPESASVNVTPHGATIRIGGFHPDLLPDFHRFFLVVDLLAAGVVLLLAAAVARRLHDRGLSGWWGAMPLPFLAIGLWLAPDLFASFSRGHWPDMRLFQWLLLDNLAWLATLIVLIVLLATDGAIGPNRYGPDPLRP